MGDPRHQWSHAGLRETTPELAAILAQRRIILACFLIPLISGYLVWNRRKELVASSGYSGGLGWSMAIAGTLALGAYFALALAGWSLGKTDSLAWLIFSFICLVNSCCLLAAGKRNTSIVIFPLALLFLMLPLPSILEKISVAILQRASAEVAYILIKLSGMPVFREGLVFTLPNFRMEVAEECSGIRSTLVLFITSLLAGHLFLRRKSFKGLLALAVLPIGILRNGFRILVITWLTVNVDRTIGVDGPVHKKGGPFFFVLSLGALFGLLFLLRRFEERRKSGVKDQRMMSSDKRILL